MSARFLESRGSLCVWRCGRVECHYLHRHAWIFDDRGDLAAIVPVRCGEESDLLYEEIERIVA